MPIWPDMNIRFSAYQQDYIDLLHLNLEINITHDDGLRVRSDIGGGPIAQSLYMEGCTLRRRVFGVRNTF